MTVTKQQYLEQATVFRDLSSDEVYSIGHGTRLVRYTAGHLFYMPDDPAEVIFILKQGRVQLYQVSADGRKLVVAILKPGAIFGHMALVGQNMHANYAQAVDDVVICVWNRQEIEALLIQKPQVALRFLDARTRQQRCAGRLYPSIAGGYARCLPRNRNADSDRI
jgi:CRP/FNR family transcriptional regulator, cyclic AMP receptor protein